MNDRIETGPVIDTRAGFAAALRWGFERAIDGGARCITCVDPQFAEWPLDDVALLSRLAGYLRQPQRRLLLLASDFEAVTRRHPRFDAWRADWAHAIESFAPPDEDRLELPTLLVDDRTTVVELFDAVHWRGRAAADAHLARAAREAADALLQRSTPAYPVKRLGL